MACSPLSLPACLLWCYALFLQADGRQRWSWPLPLAPSTTSTKVTPQLAVAPDGSKLYYLNEAGTLHALDTTTGPATRRRQAAV